MAFQYKETEMVEIGVPFNVYWGDEKGYTIYVLEQDELMGLTLNKCSDHYFVPDLDMGG